MEWQIVILQFIIDLTHPSKEQSSINGSLIK